MFHTTKQIWLVVEPHRWSVLDNSSSTAPLSAPQCFEVRPSNHVWIRSQSWYQRMQCGYNNLINHLPVTSSIVGIVNHSQSWVVYGIAIPTLVLDKNQFWDTPWPPFEIKSAPIHFRDVVAQLCCSASKSELTDFAVRDVFSLARRIVCRNKCLVGGFKPNIAGDKKQETYSWYDNSMSLKILKQVE